MTKRSTCPDTGKVSYSTSAEAHLALESIMRKKSNRYILNHVYKCDYCNLYHLTKKEK